MTFAELGITSNFTFLTGGAHPEEYAWEAAYQGIAAIAIADENSVAGIVRAHVALRDVARRAEERRAALAETGRIGPPAPPDAPRPPSADLACLPRLIPGAKHRRLRRDRTRCIHGIRRPQAGRRADRIREGPLPVSRTSGRAAQANAEQRLRSEAEMRRIFAGHGTRWTAPRIAARCPSTLDELRYEYPSEIAEGETPIAPAPAWPLRGWNGATPPGARPGARDAGPRTRA
jgi:hypothetical protein